MRSKRVLALFTALCMFILAIPVVTAAADAAVGDFWVSGGSAGGDYQFDYDRGVLTVFTGTPLRIQNANPDSATSHRIVVAAAATLTLAGVNIDTSGTSGVSAIGVTPAVTGDVNIQLEAGTRNWLTSGDYGTALAKDGLDGKLIIAGEGTLLARGAGNAFSFALGTSAYASQANVVIKGGSVFANRLGVQPKNGDGTSVYRYVISADGYAGATVQGMNLSGADGFNPVGTRFDSEGKLSFFLPDGASIWGDITVDVDGVSTTIPDGAYLFTPPSTINASGHTVLPAKAQRSDEVTVVPALSASQAVSSVDGFTRTGSNRWTGPFQDNVNVNVGGAYQQFVVTGGAEGSDFYFLNDSLYIRSGTPLTIANASPGTSATQNIEIESGVSANLTLNNVNIDVSDRPYLAAIRIADNSAGNVSIYLAEASKNSLLSGSWSAGIQKNGLYGVGQLTISGAANASLYVGSTTSSLGVFSAAIGGARNHTANIAISGGRITTGENWYGIGTIGGYQAQGIVIAGGSVHTSTISSQPTDGLNNVFLTTVTLDGAVNATVNELILNGGSVLATGLGTDSEGRLFLYLPYGTQVSGASTTDASYTTSSPIVTIDDGSATGTLSAGSSFVAVDALYLASATEINAGDSLPLDASVSPDSATNRDIYWGVVDPGTTGASIDGNTLYTSSGGQVVVEAIIYDGLGAGVNFTQQFTINVASSFVAVDALYLASATEINAGDSLSLDASVSPDSATNRDIYWGVVDPGSTGASIDGNTLYTSSGGQVVVEAIIYDGLGAGVNFTQQFTINVASSFVAVDALYLASATEINAGDSLSLDASVSPDSATNRDIYWGVVDPGTTGASIDGNTLYTSSGGQVVVEAIIYDGLGAGVNFTQQFTIQVNAAFNPVTSIDYTGPTEVVAGESVTLDANVSPADATNTSIEWGIAYADDTGSTISDNVLTTVSAGTVTVSATVIDGLGSGESFTEEFLIFVVEPFNPVTDIDYTGAYEVTAGGSITLSADVYPAFATNTTIIWGISDDGGTESFLTDNVLTATNAGTVTVSATILDGLGADAPYSETFTIQVNAAFVPVSDLVYTGSTEITAGDSLELTGYVSPDNATNSTIEWGLVDAGDTGASLSGNVLSTVSAGTVTVSASVLDGLAVGEDYSETFTIQVNAAFVPVSDLVYTGSTEITAGDSLELTGYVSPDNASNSSIEWGLVDAGDTGASLSGNVLSTVSAGTVTVSASVLDGLAVGEDYSETFTIQVNAAFVPVSDLVYTGSTEITAGDSLELTGYVSPDNATNSTIEWGLVDAGDTGASLSGNVLSTVSAGTITVSASVLDGLAVGEDYSGTFTIQVNAAFVPVSGITLAHDTVDAGSTLTLSGTIEPTTATKDGIVWSLVDAGTTGAVLDGNQLTTVSEGTATVTASVIDGRGTGDNYVETFTITVNAVFIPVTDIVFDVSEMVAGQSLVLTGSVLPVAASDTHLIWSIRDAGTTGAVLNDVVLEVSAAGVLTLEAIVENGSAMGERFSKVFTITVEERFIPVERIDLAVLEFTTDENLTLNATVVPAEATNQEIVWSIANDGGTGAAVDGGVVTATSAGSMTLRATINDGLATENYTQDFTITVTESFVAVTSITLETDTMEAGSELTLVGYVSPDDATHQTVSFALTDIGTTGATYSDGVLRASRAGTVTLRASVANGFLPGADFTQDVTVTVTQVEVTDIQLDVTEMQSGDSLELEGTVVPADATYQDIVWQLYSAGTTGATLSDRTLTTAASGRLILKASIAKGRSSGLAFTKYFEIIVNEAVVLVSDIEILENEMLQGETLTLEATVLPAEATSSTIAWTLRDAGTTGATLTGNALTAPNAGTAWVTATIVQDGHTSYTKDFPILVHSVFTAVEDIIDVPKTLMAGDALTFAPTVLPDNATHQNVFWIMTDPGTTRSTLSNGVLQTAAGGVVKVVARIRNGLAIGDDFVKTFEITVDDSNQRPVTPVFTVNLPLVLEVTEGNQIGLSVEIEESNAEAVRYEWYKDGVLLADMTEETLQIDEASLDDAGRYHVVVTNILNGHEASVESNRTDLTIKPAPLEDYHAVFGNQQTYRGGNTGLLFGVDIPFEKFSSMSINGVVVPPVYYDAREGSTIVELSAVYLNMLKNGTYHARFNAVDGYTELTFYVNKEAETTPTAPIQTGSQTYPQVTATGPSTPTTTSVVAPTQVVTTPTAMPTTTPPTDEAPPTGEGSSRIYLIIGGVLIALAVVVLIVANKRRHDDDDFDDLDDEP